jgi:6,7-dimethyl-8-ribityllumazine synthase
VIQDRIRALGDLEAKLPKLIEGHLNATGMRFAIVAGRFNSFITERLVEGALDTIRRSGGDADNATLIWVPGAYEIPLAVQGAAKSGKFDAIIALGTVIRGSTPHFDYVAGEVSKGVGHVMLAHELPVAFGVLTTDTIEQAVERAGTKAGNKGSEATMAAIEMVDVMRKLGA